VLSLRQGGVVKKVFWAVFFIFSFFPSALSGAELDISPRTRGEGWSKDYIYRDILVRRVVDGDTLLLENNQRVRLIGIDTPEMHDSDKLVRDARRSGEEAETIKRLGRQAYEFTRNLAEGKRVRLEFDAERFDKYKRLLAYAYLSDGTFLNAEIIGQGYASPMTYPPNVRHADLFLKLYRQAREERRGLWK